MYDFVVPTFAQVPDERRARQVPRKLHASGQGEAFVANQMQANAGRHFLRSIEKISTNSIIRRFPQLIPRIPLCNNRLGKALSHEASVGLLGDLENQIVHAGNLVLPPATGNPEL